MAKWVICSGPDWNRPSVQSTKQIMDQFHKNNFKILWVNPIAFKSAALNSLSKKSYYVKIRNKLFTHLKMFKRIKKGFFLFVPFYLPVFKPRAEQLNEKLIRLQIKILKKLLGIKTEDCILWSAGTFTLLPEYKNNYFIKVTQAADFISDFRSSDSTLKFRLIKKEEQLCNSSDVIFASSTRVKSKLSEITDKPINLLLHGVHFNHFNNKHTPSKEILDIKAKGLPIAGYFGALGDTNDVRMFEVLAENNFSVVLIGKVIGDFTTLEKKQNIYLLGPREFKDIPSYGQSFDACIMSWRPSEWIKNCYPIKTLEYLAMGKPIVSVTIPTVKELFGDLIYFADTPEQYLEKAKQALAEDSDDKRRARMDAVRQYDWTDRFKLIKFKLFLDDSEGQDLKLDNHVSRTG